MTDPFEIATPTQRRVVLAALAAYVVLFVIEFATGNTRAAAAADLLLAVLVIPAGAVAIRRALSRPTTDWIAVGAAGALIVAGFAVGYEGLATLDVLTRIPTIQIVGTIALLAAFVLYYVSIR